MEHDYQKRKHQLAEKYGREMEQGRVDEDALHKWERPQLAVRH